MMKNGGTQAEGSAKNAAQGGAQQRTGHPRAGSGTDAEGGRSKGSGADDQDRTRAAVTAEPVREHAAQQRPGRNAGPEQAVANVARPSRSWANRTKIAVQAANARLLAAFHEGQRAQQPVAGQPPQPHEDLDTHAAVCEPRLLPVLAVLGCWNVAARDGGQQRRADPERESVGQEWDRACQGEQRPARGRPAEVDTDGLGGSEPAVGAFTRACSRETMLGMIDMLAGMKSVLPVASRNPAAPRRGMLDHPTRIAAVRAMRIRLR